jgi:ectoine hydroxylase-related dioxygenase (phytanoyl-CoA dioxygenase family)
MRRSGVDAEVEDRIEVFERDGFFILPSFAEPSVGDAMLDRVVEISRAGFHDVFHDGKVITPEANISDAVDVDAPAEERVSKVFRLHREPLFHQFVTRPDVLTIGHDLLASHLDCFLSQFIFKNPGAWGQPWHQDEWYFPFDRHPQVGLWLAVTEATLDNGCLWVLPGSHTEPVHDHVADRRPGANYGYVEIVDHDMAGEVPVTMQPGDLLVFHSRLMHRSTDNRSDRIRAAMVFHLAEHGTIDHTDRSPVNDWVNLD